MEKKELYKLEEAQREFGKQTNKRTWELLMKENRSPTEDQQMLEAAYASSYHWKMAGTPLNHQRAAWLLAHVYTVLGQADQALFHARACQALTEKHQALMEDFDLAYAAEGLARANALAGSLDDARRLKTEARQLGNQIKDPEDKKIFDGDLDSGDWYGL
jgi:hypothetical protein